MGTKGKFIWAVMPLALLSFTLPAPAQTSTVPMGHTATTRPAAKATQAAPPYFSPDSIAKVRPIPTPPAIAVRRQGPNAEKCTKLRASGAGGWEPVTYLDDRKVARGVAVDILQEFADRNQLEAEIDLSIPWNRGMLMLANGEIDVMAGAYFTLERDAKFLYSRPFASDDVMVFQNANYTFDVNEVRDLIHRRGARPQGGSYGDFLDHYATDYLDIIFSPTGNRILDLLVNRRVDYVMLGRYDGLANIANDRIADQIHMVETPMVKNPVMFMFSRRSPCLELVPQLNHFITELEKTGRLREMTEIHLPAVPQN